MKNRKAEIVTAVLTGIIIAGLPHRIDDTHYEIIDSRIHTPVRIAVIADLHCRSFGLKQSNIMRIIDAEKPDLVVLPGDLLDKGRNLQNAFDLIYALQKYQVYYASGNHDLRLEEKFEECISQFKRMGVHVLENREEIYQKNDTYIEIAGMHDQGHHVGFTPEQFSRLYHTDYYRILISHRPDYRNFYRNVQCDLIICGHNHGGQWRIPFTHQGLYAPGDGFLPKYTEGIHDLNGREMVISRGLATGAPGIPRLYNNPEIVFINLKGGRHYEAAA